ncbi:hypothetical protein [Streptosporangium vulgare]|uniref:hypothetical protein n=1 Tax=Streptosporangium vulgare TaxID=46190 RepID=UPI0031D865EC
MSWSVRGQRDRNAPCALELTLPEGLRPVEHLELTDDDLSAVNSADVPDRVVPRRATARAWRGARASLNLSPVSWNIVRFAPLSPQE